MFKTVITAAFAALSLAAVAVPANAATPLSAACESGTYSIGDNEGAITSELESQGYAVSGVEEWAGCVRAYLTNADGSTSMAFFDPFTLQQVGGDTVNI